MMAQSLHSPAGHEITSEVAYDLLQDHMETVLALLDHSMSRKELVTRLGGEKVLARMERQGLVAREGEVYRAVASIYHQLRQEGMISFLERYVLPAINASLGAEHDGGGFATLRNVALRLTPDEMRGLRAGPVQGLINDIAEITDRPATGVPTQLTVLIVGTSKLAAHDLDDTDRALRHVQYASIQRSTPEERDFAVLTQVAGLADGPRYTAAMERVDRFVDSLRGGVSAERATSTTEATYHLTVASHWRSASASETDLGGNKPC